MTPNDSPAAAWDAMSDEQKVDSLAQDVMDWRESGHEDVWIARKSQGGTYINGQWVKMKREFRPLTEANHAAQVITQMRAKGFYFKLEAIGETNRCEFYHHVRNKGAVVKDKDFLRAICKSAYYAANERT